MSLKRLLYSLFLYLIFPLVMLRLLIRSRLNPNYRKRWSERLGLISYESKKPVIWIHAVSVGEAIAAKPLIMAILDTYPETPVLVTTTTPTGSDRVKAMFSKQIENQHLIHYYFPYDLLGSVARFVKVFQPKILIVVETEIWPNLYAKCYQNDIPIVMVNARLSEKSTQSYLKIRALVAETLVKVSIIAVRSKNDAERFFELGANASQIQISGNIKYDISKDLGQTHKSTKLLKSLNTNNDNPRLIFVAASTHRGEDSIILFIYITLLKQFPNMLLVLVPRHPERFNEVYEDSFEQLPKDKTIIRHSKVDDYSAIEKQIDVILGDSMGEMQMWFGIADVVFIGGSLVETGGHNPLEATLFGVPVVSGPHMFNFDDIAGELTAAELLFICNDEFEICKKVHQLLKTEELKVQNMFLTKDSFKQKAKEFMQQQQGVTARLLSIISTLLK